MPQKTVALAQGVEGVFVKNARFKTTQLSFNFYVPLKKETTAAFALLPFILTSCSNKYPDFSKLNYKLSKLYGAQLDASAEKYGDYQLLKMKISVINDRYSLDDESLVSRACELLLGLVFEPSVENEAFFENDVEREKRKAIEHIKGEYSEKRTYAKTRLIEEMYKNEAYGLAKCGTIEEVSAITGGALYDAWRQLLKTAYIRVHVVGEALPAGLFEGITERFAALERENIADCKASMPTKPALKINEVVDYDSVNQGKLCLGFSSEMYGNDDKTLPLMVMADIFGGGPYSRLFSNVREKQSLCYYCSASATRIKGIITVESGVEAKNAEKARTEIVKQLGIVKRGGFKAFEFESSIKSICDSFKTYCDSPSMLDAWYSIKVNNDVLYTPEETAEMVAKVTKEQVVEAAKGVKLHTVYKLLPLEEKV